MNTRPVVNEFVRFGIVGIAATALHYGIYYLLQPYINVNIACRQSFCFCHILQLPVLSNQMALNHFDS